MSSYLSNRHAQGMHNRCYFAFNKYIAVGIPRIFHPRPAPLMTGPAIYHASIVSAQIRCTCYNMLLPRTLQWTKLTARPSKHTLPMYPCNFNKFDGNFQAVCQICIDAEGRQKIGGPQPQNIPPQQALLTCPNSTTHTKP